VQVKCCTKEILGAHRLYKIRGNIAPDIMGDSANHLQGYEGI